MSDHKDPAQRKHWWQHPATTHDPYPVPEVPQEPPVVKAPEKPKAAEEWR